MEHRRWRKRKKKGKEGMQRVDGESKRIKMMNGKNIRKKRK